MSRLAGTCRSCLAAFLLLASTTLAAETASARGVPQAKYAVRLEPSVRIPMRDGVRLSTDLYFPVGATGPLPVVLIRTPYDKNALRPEAPGKVLASAGGLPVQLFVQQGYVLAVQDIRGKFESEGEWRIGADSRKDGQDTIDWLVAQTWSNGNVGTYGCSYLGENQIQLAAERNPNHKAAIPQGAGGVYTGTNRTFAFMDGGAFEFATAIGWFPRSGNKYSLAYRSGMSDAEFRKSGSYFSTGPKVPPIPFDDAFHWLPRNDPMARIVPYSTHYEDMLIHGPADPYWETYEYVGDSDRFDIPALHINSWYDLGINETLHLVNLMSRNAETDLGRKNQFAIISPTGHCESETATERTVVGRRNMGDARFAYYELYLRWFDRWLKGIENGVTDMPRLQYFLMGKNEWRSADSWPLKGTQWIKYYLRSKGNANSRYGDGVLDRSKPVADEAADRFTYDPRTPVPTMGGVVCCTSDPDATSGSYDQSTLEMRQDVLVYTTPSLERGVEVTGPIELVLYVSSSAKDTDFTGKLIDVHPDGTAYNLQDGILRARYREGYDRKVWMKEGEVYELRLDLHAVSNYFQPGHRIRLEVSSSNFPRLDRNLNTGGNNYDETEFLVARNAVHHSDKWPSHIVLPVVEDADPPQ